MNGYLYGADFAYNQGWFSQEQSILGGTTFIKEKYINVGQTTLYFQKFNVIQSGNLYNHQYMQNIRAANDEGNRMYNGYKDKQLLNANFEFSIPIYENMPVSAARRPLSTGDRYIGSINSELQAISLENVNSSKYIIGKIVIVEWINGKSTVPATLPKVIIESTDGKVKQEAFVKYLSGNTYYFDKVIDGLDKTKQYILSVELTEVNNISNNKKASIKMSNKKLGQIDDVDILINNSIIKYQYDGKLISKLNNLKLDKTANSKYYLCGEIVAKEVVNNKEKMLLDLPIVRVTSTDGTVKKQAFVNKIKDNTYYFDIFIDDLNKAKNYTLNIESITKYNISTQKNNMLDIKGVKENLGKYYDYILYRKENTISFLKGGYVGNINSELKKLSLNKTNNKSYISGEIIVVEWVDGKSTVPNVKPIMKMKSTDGKVNLDIFVTATGTNTYYFDRFIEGIDISKDYIIEIVSGSELNISNNKKMDVYFKNEFSTKTLGIYSNKKLVTQNNKLVFIDNNYIGNINSELKKIQLNKTSNKSYISGEIVIVEWIDGKSTVPNTKPIMKMKSTDGKINLDIFVTATGTNTYYFDRFIEGIDTSKDYIIEVSSGNSNNVSAKRKMNVYFKDSFQNVTLGVYNNKKIVLENNTIKFK